MGCGGVGSEGMTTEEGWGYKKTCYGKNNHAGKMKE